LPQWLACKPGKLVNVASCIFTLQEPKVSIIWRTYQLPSRKWQPVIEYSFPHTYQLNLTLPWRICQNDKHQQISEHDLCEQVPASKGYVQCKMLWDLITLHDLASCREDIEFPSMGKKFLTLTLNQGKSNTANKDCRFLLSVSNNKVVDRMT
jgi:hypothetical protein